MIWLHGPRRLLLSALSLDWLGQLLILLGIMWIPGWLSYPTVGSALQDIDGLWLIFCVLLYPLLGWLFGSYTVLRWRRFSLTLLFQRLFITALVTLMVVAFARWLVNPRDDVWLVYRSVQLVWLSALTLWSFLIRIALRRGLLSPDAPRLLLLASDQETPAMLKAWSRVTLPQPLIPISPNSLEDLLNVGSEPLLVALSSSLRNDPSHSTLIERLDSYDPRQVHIISVISLFEKQQERLPRSFT